MKNCTHADLFDSADAIETVVLINYFLSAFHLAKSFQHSGPGLLVCYGVGG